MSTASDAVRHDIRRSRRWVVKIGSALLTANGRGLAREAIADWAGQLAGLCASGHEVVIVSSGAVAEGMTRLGWRRRPTAIHELQAAAAVGQMGLVQTWESSFQAHGLHTAQVLLVHDDLSDRKRYLNARSTMKTLLGLGAVPVVNENDTVVTDEIRFGDNDTLGALVANLIEADVLVILTDQDGLFDSDPRDNPDARLIDCADADDASLLQFAEGRPGVLGRGGMVTKVRAARLAARSGAHTLIVGGGRAGVLSKVADGEPVGTWLRSGQKPVAARKQWLAGQLQTRGRLLLDDGAVRVLTGAGRSLLPVGVTAVDGEFRRGELVSCVDGAGREIARGLVNYSAEEARRIVGLPSERIRDVLGYHDEDELIHRDNLVLL